MSSHLWGKFGNYLPAGHQLETGNKERVSQEKLQDIQCNYLILSRLRTVELINFHILKKVVLYN